MYKIYVYAYILLVRVPQTSLRLLADVVDGVLLEQLVGLVAQGLLVGVLDAGVVDHQLALGQCEDGVPQPGDHLPIRARHMLVQVLGESSLAAFLLLALGRRYPDVAIVAQDHGGAAGQVVEVHLAALDESGEHLDQDALR